MTWSPSAKACTSKPLPVRTSLRAASCAASARAKSSAVVSFTLPRSPGNTATSRPAHSASAASSVKSSRPAARARRWASSNDAKRNACGVCTVRSEARSSVSRTRPPASTRFTVSVTSSAGIAAPVAAPAAMAREISVEKQTAAPRRGRAPSAGGVDVSASSPARTEACRVAPPKTAGSKLHAGSQPLQTMQHRPDG